MDLTEILMPPDPTGPGTASAAPSGAGRRWGRAKRAALGVIAAGALFLASGCSGDDEGPVDELEQETDQLNEGGGQEGGGQEGGGLEGDQEGGGLEGGGQEGGGLEGGGEEEED